MKLYLGVADVAYSDAQGYATTGEVATFLEKNYHVMETFYEDNKDKIAQWLSDAVAGEIENMALGKPMHSAELTTNLGRQKIRGASFNGHIEARFREFLSQREWKKLSGQRVEAAEAGVSHRKKRAYVKRAARPEFVDTGLYQASFRAWVGE